MNAALASEYLTGSMRLSHFIVLTPNMGCVSVSARGMLMKRLPVLPSNWRMKSSEEFKAILPPVRRMFCVTDSCPVACSRFVFTKL